MSARVSVNQAIHSHLHPGARGVIGYRAYDAVMGALDALGQIDQFDLELVHLAALPQHLLQPRIVGPGGGGGFGGFDSGDSFGGFGGGSSGGGGASGSW